MSDGRLLGPPPQQSPPGTGPASGQFLAALQALVRGINAQSAALTALLTAGLGLQRTAAPVGWAYLLGTASIQVLPINTSRLAVTFHNPIEGGNSIYVCPALDHTGSPLAAGGAGSIVIFPGATFSIPSSATYTVAGCSCAWNAAAKTGTNNPFTILEFLS